MHKKIVKLSIFLSTLLFGETQNIELVAKMVEQQNDIVNAIGDVLVYSEKYLITSDNATYNTKTGDLELFGNVNVLRGSEEMARSEYVFLNIKEDTGDFAPFFLFNQTTSLWLRCDEASGDEKFYITKNAIISSCNIENPDWKIAYTTGKLNKESSFIHLYNPVFYIKDVPILYLPYFAFPTDDTRRTGLLVPSVGYEKSDGVFFRQPIYFAPYESWDLELNPQIRTNRGSGLYSTFRFADSPYSNGYFGAGLFREKTSYARKEDLKNRSHYGYEFYYDRSSIFGTGLYNNGYEDGLLVDFQYLNDIDYLNLNKDDSKPDSYDKLITSRLNYFLRDKNNYIGVYAKYFIKTDTSNNDDTLQEVPTAHYHRFLNPLFINNLHYSFDTQYHNYYRKRGMKAEQLEMNLPLTFHTSFFDEMLRFNISENLYFMRVNYEDYDKTAMNDNFGQYFSNYHKMSLYTDLAKAYDNFLHKFYFGIDYIVPSFDKKEGFLDRNDFVQINAEIEQVRLKFKQYFYDTNGEKRVIHSLEQPYYIDEFDEKYRPLENKIELFLTTNISLNNELQYSHDQGTLIKSLSYLRVVGDKYVFDFSHTYDKDEHNNFLSLDYEHNIFKNNYLFAGLDYDFKESYAKSWYAGIKFTKKCWDYAIIYKEDVTPKLTSSGRASAENRRGIYLTFNLFPLGGVQYDFSTKNERDL